MPDGQVFAAESGDGGLACLFLTARLFQLSLDPGQIRHDYGNTDGIFDAVDVPRCATVNGAAATDAASLNLVDAIASFAPSDTALTSLTTVPVDQTHTLIAVSNH